MKTIYIILTFVSVFLFAIITNDTAKEKELDPLFLATVILSNFFFIIFFLYKSFKTKKDHKSTMAERIIISLFIALILFLLVIVFVNPI